MRIEFFLFNLFKHVSLRMPKSPVGIVVPRETPTTADYSNYFVLENSENCNSLCVNMEKPTTSAAAAAAAQDHNLLLDSPQHGPTLSSASSFEALTGHDPNLSRLATKMFNKTEEYITHELNAPLEDYKLLEEMNKATIAKYKDMRQIAENLNTSTSELSLKFQLLAPMMQQIDEISDTVDKLEAAAYKLDAYSIALENRVKVVLQRKSGGSQVAQ